MNTLKKFSILVVDDDADLREIISSVFESEGFTIYEADSGSAALEILNNKTIHFVITDVRMPNGDGISLLTQIKSMSFSNHTPKVILMSGFTDVSISDCLKKGALAFFEKPFNQKDLITFVKSNLN